MEECVFIYVSFFLVENGYAVLRFKVHQYSKTLRATDHKVNDRKEHKISISRQNQAIALELDKMTTDFETVKAIFDITDNIFIGKAKIHANKRD